MHKKKSETPESQPTTSEALNSRPLLHLLVLSQAQAPPLDPCEHVVRGSSSRGRQSGHGLPANDALMEWTPGGSS